MYLHLPAGALRAVCLAILLFLSTLGFWARSKLSSKGKQRRFRYTGAAVGNALQILHVYVDPRVRHVIVQRLEEQAEDDGDDCADPGKQLERQLRRIRRGEQVDRLTIRMREKG
jgi:hypothetical protein